MGLKFKGFSVLSCALLALPCTLSAQETREGDAIVVEVLGDGLVKTVQVSDPTVKKIIFEATSRGSNSHYIEVEANGPEGLTGTAEVQGVKKDRFTAKYLVQFDGKRKKQTQLKDKPSAGSSPPVARAAVDATPENIARIKAATGLSEGTIRILLNVYTPEEIIAKFSGGPGKPPGGPGPGPGTSAPGKIAGRGIVHKDGCKGGVKQHRIRFVVDLSAVDPAAYTSGFSVSGKIDTEKGSLVAASIKPVSDGKFAPKPLLLVEGIGYSYLGKESLHVVSWKGGKPRSIKALKINDYVSYRGYRLARIVAAGILNGGRGTIEISNGEEVGNACIRLVRSRQRVNGYPG